MEEANEMENTLVVFSTSRRLVFLPLYSTASGAGVWGKV